MAPQSANERYASLPSAKLNDAPAQVGSQLAEPSATQPSRKPTKSKRNRSCATSPANAGSGRHSRKCHICNHPKREAIEHDFLHWNRAGRIETRYGLHGKSTIYRHARATGLDVRRRETLYRAAEQVAEEVNRLETPSASAILRAVRTLASLNDRGQWVKPRSTHAVVSTTAPPTESAAPATSTARRHAPRRSALEMISNRHTCEKLEIDPTHSKQTPEVIPNRHT